MVWSLLRGSCPVVGVSPCTSISGNFHQSPHPILFFFGSTFLFQSPAFTSEVESLSASHSSVGGPSCFFSFIIPHPEASVHSSSYEQLDHHLFIIIVSRRRRGAALFAEAAQLILALPFSNSLSDPLSFMPVTSLHLGH